MKIKTRVTISTVFSIVIVIMVAIVIGLLFQQLKQASEKEKMTHTIVQGVFELNILTHDYLLYHEKRSKRQWKSKHDSLTNLLSEIHFHMQNHKSILNKICVNHNELKSIFSQLYENYESRTSYREDAVFRQLNEMLASQLLLISQEIVSYAFRLAKESGEEMIAAQKIIYSVILILFVIMAAIITANYLFADRIIVRPIAKLHEGTEIIGAGNLDFRVGTGKKDEVGQLSGAFDAMVINLKKVMASRNELQEEIIKRKEVEQALRRAKEIAESASRIKSAFLANMSHELRTPLNAIIGFSEILADKTFGQLTRKQEGYVDNVLTSGRHLLQLINDILDLSKVEAGKMELERSRVDLKGLLENSMTMVKELAFQGKISHDLQVPDELEGFEFSADERKLKQIIFNLLSNAIKFTPENGSVTLAARHLSIVNGHLQTRNGQTIFLPMTNDQEQMTHRNLLEISVTDTGIGIEPKDQERVFGEFEQVDSSYARDHEGTGLGLALAKSLVELHGGYIWVESEGRGRGSIFTFVIPIEDMEIKSEDVKHKCEIREKAMEEVVSRPLVLVVEDDRPVSELITEYLSDAGYAVAHAFDGEQAVQMARELKPYAITLDIILPKKDGWEVLEELKSFSETRNIPVIVVSITEDRQLGFSMGAVEWFVKPIERNGIVEALNNICAVYGKRDLTVLVVDDEPKTVELLTDRLESNDYKVLQAYGGRQGIDLAIEKLPDVIILDLMMPQVTGFEVVQRLREHPEARDIPILIHTAKDLTREDRQRLNSHVQAISSKSSGKEQLLGELKKLTKRKQLK